MGKNDNKYSIDTEKSNIEIEEVKINSLQIKSQ